MSHPFRWPGAYIEPDYSSVAITGALSPTGDDLNRAIGDRAACECGRLLIYTSTGWIHAGVGESSCVPHPVAMPIDETKLKPLPAGAGVWVGDAPDDEDEPEDKILVSSGILPKLIESAIATPPSGKSWEQELRVIDEPDAPEITDSQMLDWLSERFSHDSEKFNLLTLMDVGHKRSLREAIRERMTDDS